LLSIIETADKLAAQILEVIPNDWYHGVEKGIATEMTNYIRRYSFEKSAN
jgi:hypothetical protein